MLMHLHRAAGQGRAPTHRLDLQAEMLKAHGVVPIHRPLKLQAEREVQVLISPGQECSSPFRRTHLKAAIELRDVVFPQKPVRLLQNCRCPAVVTPGADVPARFRSCAHCDLAPAENKPGSSESPTLPAPVLPASGDADPPCRPPSASARNGCLDRCTKRRTVLCVRLPLAEPPSP